MFNLKMNGVEDVSQRLDGMGKQDKIEKILDWGAMQIEAEAKRLVRVDTGRLRASINTIKQPNVRRIGSSVVYAPAQEFGRSDLSGYGYTPYLRPAARKVKPQIEAKMRQIMEKE